MRRRTLLSWLTVGHLANDWPVAALWIIIPAAGADFDLTPTDIGLIFTCLSFGGALACLPFGVLGDHFARLGRLLLVTFWWVALGHGLASLAPGVFSFAVLLTLASMGNAAWHPLAAGVIAREEPHRRAQALGLHAVGGSAAETLAPVCAGALLTIFDWRGTLAVSSLPPLILAICYVWLVDKIPPARSICNPKQTLTGLLKCWQNRNGARLVALISLQNMALMALMSMIPLYLMSVHEFSTAQVGLVFSLLLIVGAMAQPFVGNLSDRVGRQPILLAGNGAATIATVALAFEPDISLMMPLMAIAIASQDSLRSVMLAAALDHTDKQEGATLGIAFLLIEGVGAVGAVAAGAAAEISWAFMFVFVALLSFSTTSITLNHHAKRIARRTARDL